MSINRRMDKQVVVRIYSLIKKNTFESVLMRWMNLELVIHSEVSQKEKNKLKFLAGLIKRERELIANIRNKKEGYRYRHGKDNNE